MKMILSCYCRVAIVLDTNRMDKKRLTLEQSPDEYYIDSL